MLDAPHCIYSILDAVVYYRVSNATISVANVENAHHSTRLLAQTTLRNILGTKTLHEILGERESISSSMQVKNRQWIDHTYQYTFDILVTIHDKPLFSDCFRRSHRAMGNKS